MITVRASSIVHCQFSYLKYFKSSDFKQEDSWTTFLRRVACSNTFSRTIGSSLSLWLQLLGFVLFLLQLEGNFVTPTCNESLDSSSETSHVKLINISEVCKAKKRPPFYSFRDHYCISHVSYRKGKWGLEVLLQQLYKLINY